MEDFNERIVSGGEMDIDNWQYSLRPKKLQEYIGQDKSKIIYLFSFKQL